MTYSYRFKDWYVFLGFTLLGMLLSHDYNTFNLILPCVLLSYAFSINDYFDQDVKKKFFLVPFYLTFLLIPFYGLYRVAVALVFFVLFTMYSAKPLRLKRATFISTLVNAFGFPLLFLFGYTAFSQLGFDTLLIFFLLAIFTAISQFFHEMVDFKEDLKNNIRSTVIKLGYRRSKSFVIFLFLISIPLSLLLFLNESKFYLFFISTSLLSVYFLFFGLKRIDKSTRVLFKRLSVVVGFIYIISLAI
jgi:4-hydroxybenzoate polyprenyltransferase